MLVETSEEGWCHRSTLYVLRLWPPHGLHQSQLPHLLRDQIATAAGTLSRDSCIAAGVRPRGFHDSPYYGRRAHELC